MQLEIKRTEIKQRRLSTGGFGVGRASATASGSSASAFDVASNRRVVPQFCEQGMVKAGSGQIQIAHCCCSVF